MLREGSIFHTFMLTKLICQSPVAEIYQAININSGNRSLVKLAKEEWEAMRPDDIVLQGFEFTPGRFLPWTPPPAEVIARSSVISSDEACRGLAFPLIESVGEADGVGYISYKFFDGDTLRHLMDSGKDLDPQSMSLVIDEVARILARGVYHGNLQPATILVGPEGVLLLEPTIPDVRFDNSQHKGLSRCLTAPAYYPLLDPRVDHLAVGILLYEFFTRVHPLKCPPEAGNGRIVRRVEQRLLSWLDESRERGAHRYLSALLDYRNPSQIRPEITEEIDDLVSKAIGIRRASAGTAEEQLEVTPLSWLDLLLNPDRADITNIWTLGRIREALTAVTIPC